MPFLRDERGASEVVGAVLLISMVLSSSLLILAIGADGIQEVRTVSDEKQASTVLQEVDSRFSTLAASSDSPETSFDFAETNPRDYDLSREGYFNLTLNNDAACSMETSLSSIRFANRNNVLVGYEAGGVWKRFPSNGSTAVTSPAVTYRAGTVDVNLVNLSGQIDQSTNRAALKEAASLARTRNATDNLFNSSHGSCARPDNLSMKVQSTFYEAWASYLQKEFNATATPHESNETVTMQLEQSKLPERANDSQNNVVNLSAGGTYNDITINSDSITVDKGSGNIYSVSATPMSKGELNVGNVTFIENATNVSRAPIDIVYVLDESGSMDNTDSDSRSRSEEAQEAARNFNGDLNHSKDRGAVISYDDYADYRRTASQSSYISGDFSSSGVNGSINDIPDFPNGGTHANLGLVKANNVLGLQSSESRNKIIILLTDGVNDGCYDTNDNDPYDCSSDRNSMAIDQAINASKNGATVYTVGYGDDTDIDEAFLKEVAEKGGGTFNQATNADELEEVFKDIQREVSKSQVIAKSPQSTNFTSGNGEVYAPSAAGATGQVSSFSINGQEFSNINDPTAASKYSHMFALSDDEKVKFEAYNMGCDEWAGTGRTKTHNGKTFSVARCTNVTKSSALSPTAVKLDGDYIGDVLREDEAWWQDDVNETLNAYNSVGVNITSNASASQDNFGKLDLESNQALVYWDLPDGSDSANRMLVLYEIGLSESEAETEGVVNIKVNNVKVG
jgi:Mg-chelatase subunit ChlD